MSSVQVPQFTAIKDERILTYVADILRLAEGYLDHVDVDLFLKIIFKTYLYNFHALLTYQWAEEIDWS